MRKRFFLSHSSKDKALVQAVAERLQAQNVFFDKWDLDAGTPLPLTVADAVDTATAFVLFFSLNAAKSNWVKYELNVAVARHIEDQGYRILVVALDSTSLPAAVRHFQRLGTTETDSDKVVPIICQWLLGFRSEPAEAGFTVPTFLDRHSEQATVEQLLAEGSLAVLWLTGLFGIGKRTFAQHLSARLFGTAPRLIDTAMLGPTSLAWSLYDPSLGLPTPDGDDQDPTALAAKYIRGHREKGRCLVLTSADTLLDDETSAPVPLLQRIVDECISDSDPSHPPLILASRRAVHIPPEKSKTFHKMKLRGLPQIVMPELLRRWVRRVSPSLVLSQTQLAQIAASLHGYPLGARLVAYIIAEQPSTMLLEPASAFRELRLDIAKALITQLPLSPGERAVLEALALLRCPVTARLLSQGLPNISVPENIDTLAEKNLIEHDGLRLWLQPLVDDLFWKQALNAPTLPEICGGFANLLRREGEATTDLMELPWRCRALVSSYRLYWLAGMKAEAQSVGMNVRETLPNLARELYDSKHYHLALEAVEEYLSFWPQDQRTRLLKGQCLGRLDRFEEARKVLDALLAERPTWPAALHARGRIELLSGDMAAAKPFFVKALQERTDYIPSIRDLADCEYRSGRSSAAKELLDRALDIDSTNPFILSLYAKVLEGLGMAREAEAIVRGALKLYPKNAAFNHRLAEILKRQGRFEAAREFAERAVSYDSTLNEAQMLLAGLYVDLSDATRARTQIESLRKQPLSKRKLAVLRHIEAEILI